MKQAKKLLRSYLRVTQQMSRQFRCYFEKLDLTFPQMLILVVLGEEGAMPISQLALRTGSANSTVSGVLDRLEKLNLVKRERSEEDRRVIYVGLTDYYRSVQKKSEPNVSDYLAKRFKGTSAEELEEIGRALNKLETLLEDSER